MQLSSAEKRIYKYLIEHDISNKSADSIADALYVSRTSIYRVCKKMGYSSFSHFKFANSQATKKQTKMRDVNSLDVFHHVDDYQMEHIIKQIIAAEKIYVFGTHATSLAAHYLVRQLVNLGYFAILIVDEFEFAARKHLIAADDCVVCFSNSGEYLPEVLDMLKKMDCQVIAVTKEKSSLENLANLTITFDFQIDKEDPSFDRENIFNLIVVSEKLLVNLKAIQP